MYLHLFTQDVYVKIKQAIICQYEELWMLLMKNQEQAFSILEAENESLNQHLTQLAEDEKNYHQKSEEMKNKVQNLRKKKKENPVILLVRHSLISFAMGFEISLRINKLLLFIYLHEFTTIQQDFTDAL